MIFLLISLILYLLLLFDVKASIAISNVRYNIEYTGLLWVVLYYRLDKQYEYKNTVKWIRFSKQTVFGQPDKK
jgi:hypothetical protein